MGNKFDEFFELLKLDRKKSPFAKAQTIESRYKELRKEVEEISYALKKNDFKNLKEELGDSLLDLFCLMVITEEKGLFTSKEIVDESIKKLKRRKPWLFKEGKVTIEEEKKMWYEIKKKEKDLDKR